LRSGSSCRPGALTRRSLAPEDERREGGARDLEDDEREEEPVLRLQGGRKESVQREEEVEGEEPEGDPQRQLKEGDRDGRPTSPPEEEESAREERCDRQDPDGLDPEDEGRPGRGVAEVAEGVLRGGKHVPEKEQKVEETKDGACQ